MGVPASDEEQEEHDGGIPEWAHAQPAQTASYKVVVAGRSNAGKTQLLNRLLNNRFEEEHVPTVRAAIGVKTIEIGEVGRGEIISIQLWDLPAESHPDVSATHYKDADGLLVVFSVEDREAFDAVPATIDAARKHWIPAGASIDDMARHVPVVILGNKMDLASRDLVRLEKIGEMGRLCGCCGVAGSSAVTGLGTAMALKHLVKEIRAQRKRGPGRPMMFSTNYVVSSGPPGLPPFGTALPDLMGAQIQRGVLCPLPLVVDVTVQFLQWNDTEASSFVEHSVDPQSRRRIIQQAEFVVAALERDRHDGILFVWGCQEAAVVATVLYLFLQSLPDAVVPSSVYTTFVEKVRTCKAGDETIRFRVDAVLMHLDSVQHRILHSIVQLLVQWSAAGRDVQFAVKRLSPVLLGGWTKECEELLPYQHLLHLLVVHHAELQW